MSVALEIVLLYVFSLDPVSVQNAGSLCQKKLLFGGFVPSTVHSEAMYLNHRTMKNVVLVFWAGFPSLRQKAQSPLMLPVTHLALFSPCVFILSLFLFPFFYHSLSFTWVHSETSCMCMKRGGKCWDIIHFPLSAGWDENKRREHYTESSL